MKRFLEFLNEKIEHRRIVYHVTSKAAHDKIMASGHLQASHSNHIPKPGVKLHYTRNGHVSGYTKNGVHHDADKWKEGEEVPVHHKVVHVTRNKHAPHLHMGDRPGEKRVIPLDVHKLKAAGYHVHPRLGDYGRSGSNHYRQGRREQEEIIHNGRDDFDGIHNVHKYIAKDE